MKLTLITLITLAATAVALAGCASTPEAAAICAMHRDAATVAAVNEVTGIDAKTAAEKKLALDLFCAAQIARAASAP